jgi:hypothetical protein
MVKSNLLERNCKNELNKTFFVRGNKERSYTEINPSDNQF